MGAKRRVFSAEFKAGVARRMLDGDSVTALRHEFQIRRSVLYRWRDAYRQQGALGWRGRWAGRQDLGIRHSPAPVARRPRRGASPS